MFVDGPLLLHPQFVSNNASVSPNLFSDNQLLLLPWCCLVGHQQKQIIKIKELLLIFTFLMAAALIIYNSPMRPIKIKY